MEQRKSLNPHYGGLRRSTRGSLKGMNVRMEGIAENVYGRM